MNVNPAVTKHLLQVIAKQVGDINLSFPSTATAFDRELEKQRLEKAKEEKEAREKATESWFKRFGKLF